MLGVCIPANILDQTQLENFRIMCINDGTIGLFEVTNKILKQSHLHFESLVLVILLHHLQEGRSNLGNFLCTSKMQHRRGLARLGAEP